MQNKIIALQSQTMAGELQHRVTTLSTVPSHCVEPQLLAYVQISVGSASGVQKLGVIVCRVDNDVMLLMHQGNQLISMMVVSGSPYGRIYDAHLGRFLQADPFVQAPFDTQMLNRYSYVRNNPLAYTDPSGYFIPLLVGIIAKLAGASILHAAIAVGVASFAVTLASGGSFGDALISGVSSFAFAFAYVGGEFFNGGASLLSEAGFEFVVTVGVIGGITSALQGGNFGHGFVSAAISSVISVGLGEIASSLDFSPAATYVTKIIAGGTISKVTGGKFANGALTAALALVVSNGAKLANTINKLFTPPSPDLRYAVAGLDATTTAAVNQQMEEMIITLSADLAQQAGAYASAIYPVHRLPLAAPDPIPFQRVSYPSLDNIWGVEARSTLGLNSADTYYTAPPPPNPQLVAFQENIQGQLNSNTLKVAIGAVILTVAPLAPTTIATVRTFSKPIKVGIEIAVEISLTVASGYSGLDAPGPNNDGINTYKNPSAYVQRVGRFGR